MNVLHVGHFDPAAAAWNYSLATNAHTKHQSKVMMLHHTYAAPEADVWLDNRKTREAAFAWADIVVWHVGVSDANSFGDDPGPIATDVYQNPWCQSWFDKKPAVFWLNGSLTLRDNVAYYKERFQDIPLVATTPDLCRMFEAFWVPVCVPGWLDAGDYTRNRLKPEDRLHVFHGAASLNMKDTRTLSEAVTPIGAVQTHAIRNWPFLRAMALKASCDVTFDHLQGYYGASTVEALALGQPAIVRLDDNTRLFFQEHVGSVPPVLHAEDAKTTRDVLLGLAAAREGVGPLGAACRSWYAEHFANKWKAERWVKWLEAVV